LGHHFPALFVEIFEEGRSLSNYIEQLIFRDNGAQGNQRRPSPLTSRGAKKLGPNFKNTRRYSPAFDGLPTFEIARNYGLSDTRS
jgi:hypothetical protein